LLETPKEAHAKKIILQIVITLYISLLRFTLSIFASQAMRGELLNTYWNVAPIYFRTAYC